MSTLNLPPKYMTGAEFRQHFLELAMSIKDEDFIYFGAGDLSFYRPKERGPIEGPRLVQIEFNEIYKVHPDFSR